MTWLVTGGAGYLGAHVVREFLAADLRVVVLDDLSTGRLGYLPGHVAFTRGTILDGALLERVFDEHDVTGVVHLAGFTSASTSVRRPLFTYEQNVDGTTVLLAAMQDRGVDRIVFASSAAVYGDPGADVVTEDTPRAPTTPYGESKLIGEWLLRDQQIAAGLRHTSLRCFTIAGSGDPTIGDTNTEHLVPHIVAALTDGTAPTILGDDHPTLDCTAVRDYVHVADVARAHLAAAQRLDAGAPLDAAYNLGSGEGSSVAEILAVAARVTGIPAEPAIAARREGDPARLVADAARAARDLDWRPRHSLDEMLSSAWAARQAASTP